MTTEPTTTLPGDADAGQAQARAHGRHRLGAELRQLRHARSLRLEDVAAKLELAPSTLSRMETGQAPVKADYLTAMLNLYRVHDQAQRTQLTNLARDGRHRSWHDRYHQLLPAGASHYLDLETTATRLRSYSVHAIPGLAQTASYAAAAISAACPGLTARQVRELVTLQVQRQELTLAAGRRLHLILDESALLRPVATTTTMTAQLRHLLTFTAHPAVTLQVAELAKSVPVLTPPFTILTFPGPASTDAACQAGIGGQITITTRHADLRALHAAFTTLATTAASPEDTTALIKNTAAYWDDRCTIATKTG